MAILATVLALGGLWGGKAWQKHSLEELKAEIRALETAQNSAKSAYDNVQNEINRVKRLHGSLSMNPDKVSGHFTDILSALSRTLPKYSRIESVRQEPGCTRIAGATMWPQEVSGFAVNLQESLRDAGLRVVPLAMKPADDSSETLFEMEVR